MGAVPKNSIKSYEMRYKLVTTESVLTEIGNALAKSQWRELAVVTMNDLRDDEDVEILPITPTV